MKPWMRWTLTPLVIIAASYVGYRVGGGQVAAPTTQPADDTPTGVASVQTAPIQNGKLTEAIVAYGLVQAEPSDVAVTSVPFEIRVRRVLVRPGQAVQNGQALCDVEPSADTQLELRQSQLALEAAQKDFDQTQQRFADKLATNSDLLTSQNNLQTAQAKVDSLIQGRAQGPQTLKAAAGGIVSKVDVQEGQIVPSGQPLVEIAGGNRIEARLGLEPDETGNIHLGDSVTLVPVSSDSATPITGTVALISQRLDPDTRLVDVIVSVPPHSGLLLDGFVRGELSGASAKGLIVPRAAVLPSDEGYNLFTVKDGKAVEHAVKVVIENDDDMIVSADDLSAGDGGVVVGNHELDDGVPVTVQNLTTSPATAAATTEAAP